MNSHPIAKGLNIYCQTVSNSGQKQLKTSWAVPVVTSSIMCLLANSRDVLWSGSEPIKHIDGDTSRNIEGYKNNSKSTRIDNNFANLISH